MRIFGLNIGRKKTAQPVPDCRRGWRTIFEPYTGAWQRNEELKVGDLSSYPTLYACLNRIATDIGKLPFVLKGKDGHGIWRPIEHEDYTPVLRKPNGYQTAQQFREAWILSKLMDGNAYILKHRDNRGVVVAMYVLDPSRVRPAVTEAGRVFYEISYGQSQNLLPADYPGEQMMIPASEIIHDRINCLHHPLIGVPPLTAAAMAAGKNIRILRNSSSFFENNAQPGGIVTAPAGISEEDAAKLERFFNDNFTGEKSGRIGVVGADLKFSPFAFKAADSQLVEQMRYSDEQICQPFGVPPFKIGIGSIPAGLGVDEINLLYMEDALHGHIIAMESLLAEGLGTAPYRVDMPEIELMRMDHQRKANYHGTLRDKGIETVNEARLHFDYGPLEGGDTVYMQQQDFPLDQVRLNRIVSGASSEGGTGAAATEGNIQQEALNGAQVTALQGIIFAVAQGQLDAETARALIEVAFPLVTNEQIDAMLENATSLAPAEPATEPEGDADEVRRLTAELWQHKALQATQEDLRCLTP